VCREPNRTPFAEAAAGWLVGRREKGGREESGGRRGWLVVQRAAAAAAGRERVGGCDGRRMSSSDVAAEQRTAVGCRTHRSRDWGREEEKRKKQDKTTCTRQRKDEKFTQISRNYSRNHYHNATIYDRFMPKG